MRIAVMGTGRYRRLFRRKARRGRRGRGIHRSREDARGAPKRRIAHQEPARRPASQRRRCDRRPKSSSALSISCVFGVKLWDTEEAARLIKPLVSGDTAVVSFQNGVDKDDVLRGVLGDRAIVGGVSYIAATIAEPGVIAHSGPMQRLVFGEYDGGRLPPLRRFSGSCRRGKIDAALSDDIEREIWEKFVFLVGLSGTTAPIRTPIGPIAPILKRGRFCSTSCAKSWPSGGPRASPSPPTTPRSALRSATPFPPR